MRKTINNKLNLFEILQNPAVGLIGIHAFIFGYYSVAINKDNLKRKFPPLEFLFFVLPIVYDKNSMMSFRSSFELYTAMSKDKSITLGLQERANKMSKQTFDSINLGFSKKVLIYNQDEKLIELTENFKSKKILIIMKDNSETLKNIEKAAFQLGNIFAKKDEKMLQLTLNVRF
ncbi:three component ABC system middle component [Flavobacterium sp. DGU11]|uniref:Three component ABC system middle component n=1 Tax=Flavobacterium arundinis TaxID=3139143 RepID=A0ABU9HTI6_9FLAO